MPDGSQAVPRVFTVPPDVAFLPALAHAVLSGDLPIPGGLLPAPEDLPGWTILVPTRRAARALSTAFYTAAGGGALLLPHIRPLGDVDEEELLIEPGDEPGFDVTLPPAMPAIEREFRLARLILDWAAGHPGQPLAEALGGSRAGAFRLAASLGRLIDGFETEGIGLDHIARLFDLDLPRHREMVLDFLGIVQVELPRLMRDFAMIGEKERRSRLIEAEAERLAASPPAGPVIAAGSTGSIPATARLLAVIARLPHGAVVLPGLDQQLDEASWQALNQQHPQYGLKELITAIGTSRAEVPALAGFTRTPAGEARARFASEIMRPAATSERWDEVMHEPQGLRSAVDGLSLIEAPDQRGEALAIALALRETLETPGETAALVTPDRELARRVKGELARWGIEVDDSAGEPLSSTPAGQFALAVIDAAHPEASPVDLMALLDHRLAAFGIAREEAARAARALDALLRGEAGLAGHAAILAAARGEHDPRGRRFAHPARADMSADDFSAAQRLGGAVETVLNTLGTALNSLETLPLNELVCMHLRTLEAAHADRDGDTGTRLWTGEDGEALAAMFRALRQHAHAAPEMTAEDYRGLVAQMLARVPVRSRRSGHARLAILGLLEARLVRADVVILGGLTEGSWPGETLTDPWLNRPQRARIDLPLPERRIGLQAHDFAQGMCAPRVMMSWAARRSDSPASPSRWLVRLRTLIAGAGLQEEVMRSSPWLHWAEALDRPEAVQPAKRPMPCPPVAARPKGLSVTRIDDLANDPYRIFARAILKLYPLDPLIRAVGAAERGILIHEALSVFVRKYPGPLPHDAVARLIEEFDRQLAASVADQALAVMLRPRLERIACWFVQEERRLRETITRQFTEVEGRLEIEADGGRYHLSAKADRIDVLADGAARLIDYKSGSVPSLNPGTSSYSLQLDLEAAMLEGGGFDAAGPCPVAQVTYLAITGRDPPGEWKRLKGDPTAAAARALEECRELFSAFARPETPYIATDWSDEPGLERDYGQLSRWREWGQGRGREETGDE